MRLRSKTRLQIIQDAYRRYFAHDSSSYPIKRWIELGSVLAGRSDDFDVGGGAVKLWDLAGAALGTFQSDHVPGRDVLAMLPNVVDESTFSPDGQSILTRHWKNDLILLRKVDGSDLKIFTDNQWAMDTVAYSPNGDRIAASDINGVVHLWDTAGNELKTYPRDHRCTSLIFTRDGRYLLFGMSTGDIELWPAYPLIDEYLKSTAVEPLSSEELKTYNIVRSNRF